MEGWREDPWRRTSTPARSWSIQVHEQALVGRASLRAGWAFIEGIGSWRFPPYRAHKPHSLQHSSLLTLSPPPPTLLMFSQRLESSSGLDRVLSVSPHINSTAAGTSQQTSMKLGTSAPAAIECPGFLFISSHRHGFTTHWTGGSCEPVVTACTEHSGFVQCCD